MRDEDFAADLRSASERHFQFAWRMSNSRATADDVMQDVFLAWYSAAFHLEEVAPRSSLSPLPANV